MIALGLLFVLAVPLLAGCLSAVPSTAPTTPASSAQVSSCETDETVHNVSVIGGIVLGGATAGLGTLSAVTSDESTQKAMATTSIFLGVLAAGVAAVAGIEAQNYSNSACSLVLGPLPTATK